MMKIRIRQKMGLLAVAISIGIFGLSSVCWVSLGRLASGPMEGIRRDINFMVQGKEDLNPADIRGLAEKVQGLQEEAREVRKLVYNLTLVIFAVSLMVAVLASRMFIHPIQRLQKMVEYLSAGDFISEVEPIGGSDELRDLYLHMSRLRANLGGLIEEISGNGAQVATAAQELHVTSTRIVGGMKDESDKNEQIAASIDELNMTIQQMAGNASESLRAAEEMVKVAENGNQKTLETRDSMARIAKIFNEAADMGGALARKTQEIGNITRVIDDIVEQTHLLAFNAAIEAAQAGEQGRGFAVVADEVRKLSERTSKATKEISRTIEAIQQQTGDTVAAMCEGIERVEEGTARTGESGDALRNIVECVTTVKDMVTQIAVAAEQGSQASNQIAANIEDSSHVSKMISLGAEESLNASLDLSRLASELERKMTVFRVLKGGNER